MSVVSTTSQSAATVVAAASDATNVSITIQSSATTTAVSELTKGRRSASKRRWPIEMATRYTPG